jgi:2-polyprenyl-3-methyl-5-hydroxy-6-metoxy-1,4-benzoquinol methylase
VTPAAQTGERLNEESDLFEIDRLRHLAAYEFAKERARDARTLDFGCGSGYGAAELAEVAGIVVGMDRFVPEAQARYGGVRYLRADLKATPLRSGHFDLVVSFQVIEHLVDPSRYLEAIAEALAPNATALISTPNILKSDRENPFHVHEYAPEELRACLLGHFREVEMLGVGTSPAVANYYEERLHRIRRIVRLDPLGLRRHLPRSLVDWLFANLAVLVRRGIQTSSGFPDADIDDFPIAAVDDSCLDLLAVCREPIGRDRSR